MRIVGIDPGMEGAAALIITDMVTVTFEDAPTVAVKKGRDYLVGEMASIMMRLKPDRVGIEKLVGFPKMSNVACFKLGFGLGLWEGILAALCIPYTSIRPQEWKKDFGLINQPKEASRACAQRLFPSASRHLERAKDHNRADALLIAEFVRRTQT